MESGQEPSAIERAVLASERRRVVRARWYHHRALWGACGICIGLVGGVGLAKLNEPDNTPPFVASTSAPQTLSDLTLKPQFPKIEKMPETQPPKKDTGKAAQILNAQMPIATPDYPRMPMPAEFREIRGSLAPAPVQPEVEVRPVEKAAVVPPAEDETKKQRAKEIRDRILSLQAQKDELLKSFYEDAIPVKHIDEDIAKAVAELKELDAKK
ncbi:MAG: hypothetical protein ACAH95_12745 [Fimbriimonas sp.]